MPFFLKSTINLKSALLPIVISIFFILLFMGLHQISYSILFIIIIGLRYSFEQKLLFFTYNKSLLLILIFFLIHIISILYSSNKGIAFFDIEVKLSIFLFPILFLFTNRYFTKIYIITLKLFFFISSFFSTLLLLIALVNIINGGTIHDITYSNFSILLHPSYFAIYNVFAIIIGTSLTKQTNKQNKLLYNISQVLIITSIFFSNSKSGILSLLIISLYISIKYLYNKSKVVTILSIIFILIISIYTVNTNSRLKTMLNVTSNYKEIINNPNTYKESTGLRILSWNAAINLIKQNPIVGVGNGDIKPELFKEYEHLGYNKNIEIKMNVHNQFLETWLGQGIIGLIIMMLMFIIPFLSAIKEKDYVLQSFLILIFINFLFESILNTQAGTIFFGFFYSLLVTKENIIS